MHASNHIFIRWGIALICALGGVTQVFAARLYISPSELSLVQGEQATVTVYVDAQGTAINSADVNLSFPKDLLQVDSVSKTGSLFTLWIEDPTYSNVAGTVHFNGGLPSPGYSGSSGRLASIRVTAKKTGNGNLAFTSSSVTANDGLGTDVLSGQSGARLAITAPKPVEPKPSETKPALSSTLAITSTSHPDQDAWYQTKEAAFAWKLPANATAIRLSMAQDAEEKPEVLYRPPVSSKTVNGLDDGIWYFSAQISDGKQWGPTSKHVVRIDTEAPQWKAIEPKSILASGQEFTLSATDTLSGIAYLEVKVDEGSVERLSSDLYRVQAAPGDHTLHATAFDKAGNKAETSYAFSVPTPPSSEEKPSLDISSAADHLTAVNRLLLAVVEFVALLFILLFILIMGTKKLLSMKPAIVEIEDKLLKEHPHILRACQDGTCGHPDHGNANQG